MTDLIPSQQNKSRAESKKPSDQASFAIKISTSSPGSPAKPTNASSKSQMPRCCGCFPLPPGIVVILVMHLALGICRIIDHLESVAAIETSLLASCSFAVLIVSVLAYLAMLYGYAKRKVKVYRIAAKSNVLLFVATIGLMVPEVLRWGWGSQLATAMPIWVLGPVLLTFGYWTWVLYKYVAVTEQETQGKGEQSRGTAVHGDV